MWKNRIIYMLCVCAGIYYAVLYDKYVSLAVLWCIVTVPLLSVICLFFWKRQVKADITLADQMIRMGEEFSLTVTTKNSGILPVSYSTMEIKYKNDLDEEYQYTNMVCRVDAGGEERIQLNFGCNHCGLIKIEWNYIRVYDYFRLFSVKIPVKGKREVIVIPEFDIIEELLEENWEETEHISKAALQKGEDSGEIIGIRDYHPGDHPKHIHWKLSSKKRKILIKEFNKEEEDMEVVDFGLVCEEGKCDYEWYDEKIEELVNTCWTLLQAGRIHKVTWYHPGYESYQTARIQTVEDIGDLAKQVIYAGVGRTL